MITEQHISFLTKLGAKKINHARSNFLEHLKGTARLLQDWGNDQALCLAGLFHSIYGTEDFSTSTLGMEKRATVTAMIGEDAEALVYIFAVSHRRSFFANIAKLRSGGDLTVTNATTGEPIQVTKLQLLRLLELEVANLLDQAPPPEQLPDSTRMQMNGIARSLKGIVSDKAIQAVESYLAQ